MIKVLMLETADGATDGAVVQTYEKGQTYEVSEDLAEVFEAAGHAELVSDDEPASTEDDPPVPSKGKKQ
jgi:hypothetical protein